MLVKDDAYLMQTGIIKLLEIKDSDIRLMTIQQAHDAVDKGIHIGGAFSATIPLVALYYGGFLHYDIENPTKRGQDMFVLSKGHSVATVASIYADLGYYHRSILVNSRGKDSILNGHPGPILPGFHISTGPLGQGLSVAQGFALIGKKTSYYDVFTLTGDGELQAGTMWEAILYAGYRKLDNLCVLVDKNDGQLDDTRQLVLPIDNLDMKFTSFGWKVINVDSTQYSPILNALGKFKYGPREGTPTAIICHSRKGYGGFSKFLTGHKVVFPDSMTEQEMMMQRYLRSVREEGFINFFNTLSEKEGGDKIREKLFAAAKRMNLEIIVNNNHISGVKQIEASVKVKKAAVREKRIEYEVEQLPKFEKNKEYQSNDIITAAMKVFAKDQRVVSLDADLALISGLEGGVSYVDTDRALNVGIAESNMMGIAEAYAAMGFNTWLSTFCPFFDWRVLRRIAIGYQERLEVMATKEGWLSKGHGLDITFLATAPNFETNTNGATHMGNDDAHVFGGIAHLKIIDVSCPSQLLSIMRWIMEGDKGLVYLRIMRAPSKIIYDNDYQFEFGKGYILRESPQDKAIIISSGRGVHEALAAADELEVSDIKVTVVDMPSIDEEMLLSLYDSGKIIVIAEQNNGFIWSGFQQMISKHRQTFDISRLLLVNCLDANGKYRFIHSATYQELLHQFGLSAGQLVETVKERLTGG